MFLEVHTMIVDYQKRYLNLDTLTKTFPGWKSFGDWIDKGDYIECTAGWMSCFAKHYNNIFSDYNLEYMVKGTIKKFKSSKNNVIDPGSALIYGLLLSTNTTPNDILNRLGE